jgi:hypothetical protein
MDNINNKKLEQFIIFVILCFAIRVANCEVALEFEFKQGEFAMKYWK